MSLKKKNMKLSSTAYRVLVILFLLNKEKNTLNELIEKISDDKIISRTFTKEVIIKYINTLKFSGIDVVKMNEKGITSYHLRKAPFLMEFSEEEIKTLAIIQNHINYLYQPHLISSFNRYLEKLSCFISDEAFELFEKYKNEATKDISDSYKQFANIIKLIEEYCISKQTILVTYSPLEGLIQKITFEPEKIEYNNQKVYIYGINPKIHQKQYLQFDYIIDIKQLPNKSKHFNYNTNVTYRLTGKLAKQYRLYENETIINKTSKPYSIIISANSANVDVLLHRLLRYGQYCEVLSPAKERAKMSSIINSLLDQYIDETA